MARTAGEMPFLDHLEELRTRILRSLLAVAACFALGLWVVNRFHLVDLMKRPIAAYLPGGRLTVLSPTEPLMIVLKMGLIVGLVLASPILLWQLWAFLSPALYEKEKKTLVPALFVGLGLFLSGAALAFIFVVPQALRVLMTVQEGTFNTQITFDAYFSFVMQIVLALGLSCELPLLMIILAALGIVATPLLNRVRPYAVVGSFVAGALLSPGADVLSMFMLTIPLLLLYEIGVAGVWLVQRRRRKAESAGAALLLLCCLAVPARAQQPVPPQPPLPGQQPRPGMRLPGDTLRPPTARSLDTASARRLGLPSAPRMQFAPPDSIVSQLLELEGYAVTKYRADTATVEAQSKNVLLRGNAMTDRGGSVVEAASIRYQEGECAVDATGEPHLFQEGKVLIGASARFDTCKERGVIRDALTNFDNWFIRGHLAVDSSQSRIFGGNAELTSCDLPIPHYHFSAKEMKFVSKSVMVARPAVLYIRDVPVAWIPFIFQDTKTGRHSGILIPQFGFNDIVRPTRGYNRQVTNIGYYWAPNDYFDAQLQLDWYNNRYLQWGIVAQYRVLNRFFDGRVEYGVQAETRGGTAKHIAWAHRHRFNNSTSLDLNANYATNSSIIARNSIDPRVTTQQINSSLRFSKQYSWGTLTLGGSGHQNINDGSAELTAPTFSLSPKSIDIGRDITWSPSLQFTNQNFYKSPLPALLVPAPGGGVDSVKNTAQTRVSTFSLTTPIRISNFNLENQFQVVDNDSTGRFQSSVRIPDLTTPDPNDSVTVSRIRNGGFATSVEWNTSFSLPILFRSSWKLTPSVGVANAGSGPFAIRNAVTGGNFVTQGKRFRFGLSVSPTFFAFFPGFGGIARIRHSISPGLSYNYSPAATLPEGYARAITPAGQALLLKSPPSQTITLTLNQSFEAKGRAAPDDTSGVSARKFRLLSIATSSIGYDFEQAKLPGRTGWTTGTLSNTFASDLLPGFSFSTSHDLFEGQVGTTGAKFKPFLSSVNAGFSVTPNTLRGIGSLFGLVKRPATPNAQEQQPVIAVGGVPLPGDLRRNTVLNPNQMYGRGGRPFNSNVRISLSRTRPIPGSTEKPRNQSSVGFTTSFSPTRFWGLTWETMYNAVEGRFESQQFQLSRDLHEWRAAFTFTKNPNGNFAFFFSVFLTDFTDIKFDYNQTTIRP